MKEIKTKEVVRDIHVLDHQIILREGLKQASIRTKDLSEKTTHDSYSQDDRGDNDAADNMESAMKAAPYIQMRSVAGKKPESAFDSVVESEHSTGERSGLSLEKKRIKTRDRNRVQKAINKSGVFEETKWSGRLQGKSVKTAPKTSEGAKTVSEPAVQVVKRVPMMAKKAAILVEKVVIAIEAMSMALARAVRNAATQLIASITVGGITSAAVIMVICMVGAIVASPFGIFFTGEKGANGKTIQEVVREINEEFIAKINQIKVSVDYDDIQISGHVSLWPDVLAIYAVKTTTDVGTPMEVATITSEKEQQLRNIFWDMNAVSYRTEEYTEEVAVEHEEGEREKDDEEEFEEVTRLRLLISISHETATERSMKEGFSNEQNDFLLELLSDKYTSLWNSLVGGYSVGMGIIPTETTWVGVGPFIWPLPIDGSITSGYGYRTDPITGEIKLHGGIDLAAAAGTPIIAADSGIVTIANGSDPWGGGYGYYVKIDHLNGYETLYGHCSSICVVDDQPVQKGEVIAYVGSTGHSTGNHLHFEIIQGTKVDPLTLFR